MMNRIANTRNPYQGEFKRVLCVCSAGMLRSPTAALVLSQPPFNFNTRAVGISKDYALIPIDRVHLHWAEEIVCMEPEQVEYLKGLLTGYGIEREVVCLDLEDEFPFRDPKLMKLIAEKYQAACRGEQE